MRLTRTAAALSALPLVFVALGTAPAPADVDDRASASTGVARPATPVVLRAGSVDADTSVPPARPVARAGAQRLATFRVTFNRGFTRAARRAFQRAVNLWEPRITSTVPITVRATFQPADPNNLGSAGPRFFHRDFTGAPQRNTWYVDAIANKRAGEQLAAAPDIVANFNSDRTDWYFGTDRNPPPGRFDFVTVVMHEIGHGLGFLGFGRMTGANTGTVRLQTQTLPPLPSGYDRFTETQPGRALVRFPDNSTALGTALRSNALYFDSPRVRTANAGQRARLYAPAAFQPGSSYSHLNETTYPAGTPNSMMTPILRPSEAIHNPGAIVNAVFRSTGW